MARADSSGANARPAHGARRRPHQPLVHARLVEPVSARRQQPAPLPDPDPLQADRAIRRADPPLPREPAGWEPPQLFLGEPLPGPHPGRAGSPQAPPAAAQRPPGDEEVEEDDGGDAGEEEEEEQRGRHNEGPEEEDQEPGALVGLGKVRRPLVRPWRGVAPAAGGGLVLVVAGHLRELFRYLAIHGGQQQQQQQQRRRQQHAEEEGEEEEEEMKKIR